MVYAISEKVNDAIIPNRGQKTDRKQCYRQCQPNGYVQWAVESLQYTFEAHRNGVRVFYAPPPLPRFLFLGDPTLSAYHNPSPQPLLSTFTTSCPKHLTLPPLTTPPNPRNFPTPSPPNLPPFYYHPSQLLAHPSLTPLPLQQGFYRQIREIEAETNCRFHDTFLIENERAIDYTKIWIETFQRHVRPCAKIRGNGDGDAWEERTEEAGVGEL